MNPIKKRDVETAREFPGIVKWLWRLFASVRLAVILILIITCLSLIGTLVAPNTLFHSWWFLTPGFLLMLNILICSMNRWKSLRVLINGGKVKQPLSFFTEAANNTEITDSHLSPIQASSIIEGVLHKQGYRIRSDNSGDLVYLAADKNRYFKLGTYASHLSLILFVLAYIISSSFGFRDSSFIVTEGETKEVGHNTGLSLSLTSFVDEYYPNGAPRDYRSQVILYKNDQAVDRALIRVNHPLKYEGIRFYQSFFGPAVGIQVKQNGNVLFQGNIALADVSESQGYQRNIGYLDLADLGLSLRLTNAATNSNEPMIPEGKLAVEVLQDSRQIGMELLERGLPLEINGFEFTYLDDTQFSGFQVSHDPGNILVWIASSLFIAGIMMVLYFTHRQLWILIQPSPSGRSRIFIRSTTRRGISNVVELKRITGIIDKALRKNDKI